MMRIPKILTHLAAWLLSFGTAWAEEPKTTPFRLPDGSEVSTTDTIIPSPAPTQKFRKLTKQELDHINALAEQGDVFVRNYLPNVKTPGLKDYDQAFHAWQKSPNKKYTAQQVVQITGSYFGNTCSRELGMEWVEVTDEVGTDLAVRGLKKEIVSFPYSVVLKRVESHQYDFFYAIFNVLKQQSKSGEFKTR